jgi:hypothetical protein
VAHTHTDLGTDYGDRVQSKSLGLYDKCKWLFRLHTARVAGQIFRAHIKILFISEQDATHDRTVGKYLEEIPFQCLGVYEIRESFVRNVIGLDVIYEIDNIRLIPLSQVNQDLGLAGQIRNGAGFEFVGRS